jgi:UDP-glucose 4-epimerase
MKKKFKYKRVMVTGGAGFTTKTKDRAKFKYKNVLVTGGAGFIGSHLVGRLLKEGCNVTVIDDLSEGKWENLPKHTNLKKYKVSILDNVSKYVKGQEVIFHLAALPRLKRSIDDPKATHEVNVDGTFNMLLAAKEFKVKRFIFASSSSVYGNQKRLPLTEDMVPSPLVPYSLQKLIGEEYLKMFSELWGVGCVSLRYFNVYGVRMDPDSVYANLLPKFIKIIKNNERPVINGDGTHSRDFTYIDDVVDATLLAAESKFTGEVFNIGYGKRISVNKVVNILNKIMNKKVMPTHGPAAVEPVTTLASNQKAKKMLGWEPKIKFEEGVALMLKNYNG